MSIWVIQFESIFELIVQHKTFVVNLLDDKQSNSYVNQKTA